MESCTSGLSPAETLGCLSSVTPVYLHTQTHTNNVVFCEHTQIQIVGMLCKMKIKEQLLTKNQERICEPVLTISTIVFDKKVNFA